MTATASRSTATRKRPPGGVRPAPRCDLCKLFLPRREWAAGRCGCCTALLKIPVGHRAEHVARREAHKARVQAELAEIGRRESAAAALAHPPGMPCYGCDRPLSPYDRRFGRCGRCRKRASRLRAGRLRAERRAGPCA